MRLLTQFLTSCVTESKEDYSCNSNRHMYSAVEGSWGVWLDDLYIKSKQKIAVYLKRDKINDNFVSNCEIFTAQRAIKLLIIILLSFMYITPNREEMRQRTLYRELILLYSFFCTLANSGSYRKNVMDGKLGHRRVNPSLCYSRLSP